MKKVWLFVALLATGGARAQAQDLEVGVRYWLSNGSTERSHDASAVSPILLNPTSTLIYSGLDAGTLEIYARKRLGDTEFVKGNFGFGKVSGGEFTDRDFFLQAGVPTMAETVSPASGKLHYFTVDFGHEAWRSGNTTVAVFGGYQQWNERIDGHGLRDSFGPTALPPSVLVITNDLTWQAIRIGAEARSVHGRTRVTLEGALVPYAKYRNEDSHHLRQSPADLGPVPNIIGDGKGRGLQLEAEIRRSYPDLWNLDFGIGYRYWTLESTGGSQRQARFEFPLVELNS